MEESMHCSSKPYRTPDFFLLPSLLNKISQSIFKLLKFRKGESLPDENTVQINGKLVKKKILKF